jgi:hypothetical protein
MSVTTRLHLDQWGDLTVQRTQDVEPILDHNAHLRSERQKSVGTETWGRHVASIPCVILERWFNEELARGNTSIKLFGPEMDAIVQRKLQDPDWKWLRVDR